MSDDRLPHVGAPITRDFCKHFFGEHAGRPAVRYDRYRAREVARVMAMQAD